MGFNDNESKMAANIIIVFGLFVAVPVGYLIDIYAIYWLSKGTENIFTWPVKAQFGFFVLMFGVPIFHWLGYRYCQENFGWFRKK